MKIYEIDQQPHTLTRVPCRHPLSKEELASPDFEHGVSCPHCIDRTSEERRHQFRERQHQVRLAQERGEQHIGLRQRKER